MAGVRLRTVTPMTTGQVLDGQVAFITGAGSGMGAAFARRLAADGAKVVVNDLTQAAASAVAEEIGGEVAAFDVIDAKSFGAAVDGVVARHGRIDIMVNNAGIAPPSSPEQAQLMFTNQMARFEGRIDDLIPSNATTGLSDEDWDRMIKVHLYGTFHGTRAALHHMMPARRASIANFSALLGLLPVVRPSP